MRTGFFAALLFAALIVLSFPANGHAKEWESWGEIVGEMEVSLNKAYYSYFKNDPEAAKEWVNDAYFGYYEKEGVERMVMQHVSGKRASQAEYQFAIIKKMMAEGAPNKDVRQALDVLIKHLQDDANQLDGEEESALGVFIASLLILLREGFEAILVIAAIAAYLIRSGNKSMTRVVYMSGIAAVIASAIAALLMQSLFQISGANQEILEGVAMLLATVVLFFVSNWMFSKAEAEAWKNYIDGKVQAAVQSGSRLALGAAAFLAVFREGAETILFYQAMFASVEVHTGMIWLGFGVGCVALVGIFIAVRYGSLKIPLKPFFIGTSILMYIMAIAFAGGGIKELQEGDVVGVTPLNIDISIDLLGIYPTVETLLPQILLLVLVLASVFYYRRKSRYVKAVKV